MSGLQSGIFIGGSVGATTNAIIYSVTTDNWKWDDFGNSLLIGGGTAALGFAAAAIAPAGIVPGALWGFGSGGLIGGIAAELSGGNFETGFWWGGAFGLVGGAFRGYQLSKQQNLGAWFGEKLPTPKSELYPAGLSDPTVGKKYNEVIDNRLKLSGDRPKDLYHYTNYAPNKIKEVGLIPGKSGKIWLTNNGNMSPIQAQIDLALPPNRGLPIHLLKIDAQGLSNTGYGIPRG